MDCCRTAAEAGYLEAQRLLAWRYLNGQGIPRDTAAAALWFRHAAEQGDPAVQFQLAALYCTGTGVVRKLAEAVTGTTARPSKATTTRNTISPSCC